MTESHAAADNGAGDRCSTTMMVGYGCESESQEGEELGLYLTLHYELVMRDDAPEPGSKADQGLIVGYRALARRLCEETVNLVRGWKKRGRLETLAKEEKKKKIT